MSQCIKFVYYYGGEGDCDCVWDFVSLASEQGLEFSYDGKQFTLVGREAMQAYQVAAKSENSWTLEYIEKALACQESEWSM